VTRTAAILLALAGTMPACGDDDAPAADASPADAAVDAAPPADADPNFYLSETGLYLDIASQTFAPDLIEFAPTHVLWSDGAVKRRWLRLPPGATIDTADMDAWRLPVGAQLFKEFRAPDGTLLETRLIERIASTGDDDDDYWTGAFVWRADESDAVFAEDGAENVNGTQHDVPDAVKCRTCHGGEPGFALGVSLVQLSGAGTGTRVADLVAAGRLSVAPSAEFVTPGDAVTAAALGYLHANCGHCHSPTGAARPDVDMTLRLSAFDTTPEATATWAATVGMPLTRFMAPGISLRIAPGDPDKSGLYIRMSQRGSRAQMPPLATEFVHEAGLEMVRAWILSLPM
jgi:hypothetical protein